MARDELLEARLPDRDPALLEALDLVRVDVDAVDVGAQLGEARRGDEADVPRADDADRLACVRAHWTDHPSERVPSNGLLLAQSLQRGGDADHLARTQRLGERVGHPVDRALGPPGDEPQAAPVVVELELAAVDLAGLRRVVEDRRLAPGRALDAVVLADDALGDDEPVGAVLLAALVLDAVDPRLGAGVARAAGSAASGSRRGTSRGGRRRSPGPRPRGARSRARARWRSGCCSCARTPTCGRRRRRATWCAASSTPGR